MAIKPPIMGSAGQSSSDGNEEFHDWLDSLPSNEVYVKNSDGKIEGTGIKLLENGSVLAPDKFGVESGSVNFGDLITLSEAAGYLGMLNHLENKQYQMVDYWVPRDKPSYDPTFFRLLEGENKVEGQPDKSVVLTDNPLVFDYRTRYNARTNSLVILTNEEMKNVRIKIIKEDVGVALKYLPLKSAWLGEQKGYNLKKGENIIDFGDSPLPLSEGTILRFEVRADNMAILGSDKNIPYLAAYIQRGEFVTLAARSYVTPSLIRDKLLQLPDGEKLPKELIENGVNSVNGEYGNVVITAEGIHAQPENGNLSNLSGIDLLPSTILYTDSSSKLLSIPLTDFSKDLLANNSLDGYREALGIKELPVMEVNVPNGLLKLNEDGIVPKEVLGLDLSELAYTGSYHDLKDVPEVFSGDYEDLKGKPSLFSGDYRDLSNLPVLFSGSYNDLSDKPDIPDAPVKTVNGKIGDVVLTSKDTGSAEENHSHFLSDIEGLPDELQNIRSNIDSKLDKGSTVPYSAITGTPTIPSKLSDLLNDTKFITSQDIAVKSVNSKSGEVILNATDVGAAPTKHTHSISEITDLQSALDAKLSKSDKISYANITESPVIPTNNNQLSNGSGFITAANAPVRSVNAKVGAVVLTSSDIGAAPISHTHTIGDITGLQSALDSKISSGSTIPYSNITGAPTIPSDTKQLTNGAGFITSSGVPVQSVNGKTGVVVISASDVGAASVSSVPTRLGQLTNDSGYVTAATSPVTSVNNKTGAITLTASDVGATPISQATKYIRSAGTQATGVRVKYYTVTADAGGVWSLNLANEGWTEILDVQVQAVSTASTLAGIRQASINSYTATSTSLSGVVWGNNLIVSILLSGTNSLSLIPNSTVRIRIEGVGV